MNKADFVAEVARKASITRAEAARAVDAVFNAESGALSEALDETGELSIPGFGTFTKKRSGSGRMRDRNDTVILDLYAPPDISGFKFPAIGPVHHSQSVPLIDSSTQVFASEALRELALRVWENAADAEEFLTTPHGLLDGQTPLAASRTANGAERVREILLALEYGLPV